MKIWQLALALTLACGADETTFTERQTAPEFTPAEPVGDLPQGEPAPQASLHTMGDPTPLDYGAGKWEGMLCSLTTGACEHKTYVDGVEQAEPPPPEVTESGTVEKQFCTASNDECYPCDTPICCDDGDGGDGRCPGDPPGTKWGCSGSQIQKGGPTCFVPDNTLITYCAHSTPSDPNMPFLNDGIKLAIDHLNSRDDVLPPPWRIEHRGPASGFGNVCAGWAPANVCPNPPFNCLLPFDPLEYPTQVDIAFQQAPLNNTPNAYCGLPRRPDGSIWIGCTSAILVPASGTTKSHSGNGLPRANYRWNNGVTVVNTQRFIGTIVTLDPDSIEAFLDRTPSDGLSRDKRRRRISWHATCHEIGHAIGLSHSFVGEPGSNWWSPATVQASCMSTVVSHASKFSMNWSSGLKNGNQWDDQTTGLGNAEGWRLKNMVSNTEEFGVNVPMGRFGYPMTFMAEY